MDLAQFFTVDYKGAPFVLFGTAHLMSLLVLLAAVVAIFNAKNLGEPARKRVRVGMAIGLWTIESSWHLWNVVNGMWTVDTLLPLHMCSVMIWLAGYMLITKNETIYPFVYFLGIGGALQAVLTPESGIYGFPHFRYMQTFTNHSLLILSGVWMTVVEGYRPTWKTLLRVMVVANMYMVVVFFINMALGSNYLFINHKPPTASIIDLLPPWPYYIAFLELIGLVQFTILYLPFAIKDMFTRKVSATA